ncbi:ferredoxin reductase family protein [Cerasicoccus frondis]|uniref:ferredoxin reductase family protein n=1 Tax=Cerasicoccus frondis TaxID=490090 RepID=UPI002852D288|nr:ferredoxin reductase family protein [Cerasicoccus frondis]
MALKQLLRREVIIVSLVTIITTKLWLMAKFATVQPPDLWPWRGPSQLLGLLSLVYMGLALIAGARSRTLEGVFGGLDRAVRLHKKLGRWAMIILFIHLLLLIPPWKAAGKLVGDLFIPWYSPTARTPDILVTYGFFLLAFLAYNKSLPYARWLGIHQLFGALYVFFFLHIIFVPGSITEFEPLSTWIVLIGAAGSLSWLYRILFFKRFGPRYRYRVEAVQRTANESFDLVLLPTERRMNYDPGMFAFISAVEHPTLPTELHPFTISSTPVNRELRFSIRAIGDYTQALRKIEPGAAMDVYGPFGGFTPNHFVRYRRLVLVGAGIGITPFLSMLAYELTNNDFRRIWLYYIVRTPEDAGYDAEIRSRYQQADSYIDYELWITKQRGRLTAKQIHENIGDIDDYAVMLCGTTPFNKAFTKQFLELGIPRERIISEDFAFR